MGSQTDLCQYLELVLDHTNISNIFRIGQRFLFGRRIKRTGTGPTAHQAIINLTKGRIDDHQCTAMSQAGSFLISMDVFYTLMRRCRLFVFRGGLHRPIIDFHTIL